MSFMRKKKLLDKKEVTVKVIGKNIKLSVFKARRLIDQIRGHSYESAVMRLNFMPYPQTYPILKLVMSAGKLAAKKAKFLQRIHDIHPSCYFYINKAEVNKGNIIKKSRPRAKGRSDTIKRTLCHITIGLKMKIDYDPKTGIGLGFSQYKEDKNKK